VFVRVDCYQVEGTDILRVVNGRDSPSLSTLTTVFHEGKVEEVLLGWNIRTNLKAATA
jgi:hypothetical protein